jgi:hypothetical protein
MLGNETNDHAVAGRLHLDGDVFKTAGGEQSVNRTRDVFLAERVSLFERLRLGQIGRIQYLRRGELNVDNSLAFKLRNLRERDGKQR